MKKQYVKPQIKQHCCHVEQLLQSSVTMYDREASDMYQGAKSGEGLFADFPADHSNGPHFKSIWDD